LDGDHTAYVTRLPGEVLSDVVDIINRFRSGKWRTDTGARPAGTDFEEGLTAGPATAEEDRAADALQPDPAADPLQCLGSLTMAIDKPVSGRPQEEP
jgi:hypothetical protein